MIPTLFGITLVTFFIMKLAPGDPVSLKLMFAGDGLTPDALAQVLAEQKKEPKLWPWYQNLIDKAEKSWGEPPKDQTIKDESAQKEANPATAAPPELTSWVAISLDWTGKNSVLYWSWLRGILKFDFGFSVKDYQPVTKRILEALPITLALNIISICIVYFISIPLGVWSAYRKDSLMDKMVMIKLFVLYSLPSFWVATLLLTYLSSTDYFNLFPLMGFESDNAESFSFFGWLLDVAWHLILPIFASVYGGFAFLTRFVRANFLEVIQADYIRTARAKGLAENKVLFRHAFRNSLIPLVTLMATLLPALIGGSVIIEKIFSIPGMGLLSLEAVLGRDTNLVMGITTISAFLTLLSLLISDILYVVIDPRISFEGR